MIRDSNINTCGILYNEQGALFPDPHQVCDSDSIRSTYSNSCTIHSSMLYSPLRKPALFLGL